MSAELNQKLLDTVLAQTLDFNHIRELLDAGADPLGDLPGRRFSCVLAEMFCEASENISETNHGKHPDLLRCMPRLIELFLAHGMDVSQIKPKNADGGGNHAIWCMHFCCSEEAIESLRLLIEHGLRTDALEDFVSHFFLDTEMCDGCVLDEGYLHHLTSGLKMIMLAASYPEVLSVSGYLRSCIELDDTNSGSGYDLTRFRNWQNYEYSYDLSTCDNLPHGLRNATVEIFDKEESDIVWTLHI